MKSITMKIPAAMIAFLFLLVWGSFAQGSKVFILDAGALSKVRESVQANGKEYREPYKKLIRDADKILNDGPVSVMDKSQLPPSGDKHDYMSLARYFWPDPAKPDGLPYIQKDGETNPEIESVPDRKSFEKVGKSVSTFALAYFFTGEEKYAEKASILLRAWFLDPQTLMNPNWNFGQMVKGKKAEGRPSGLIEARPLSQIVDAIGLIGSSKSWTEADQKGMEDWYSKFYHWLTTSEIALKESATTNNHGIWFDVQKVSVALFLGKNEEAAALLNEAKTKRIATQIDTAGRQPRELARTRSFHYTHFNLEAMFKLASMAGKLGIDLWNYSTEDGRSIRKALDWTLPYVMGDKEWENQQIDRFKVEVFYPELLQAAYQYKDERYLKAAEDVSVEGTVKERVNLYYPKSWK